MQFRSACVTAALLATCLTSPVSAQNNSAAATSNVLNSTEVNTELASVLLQFRAAGIVPQSIPEERFQLSSILSLKYPDTGDVALGATTTRNATLQEPSWTLNYTEAVDDADPFASGLYTTVMVDFGAPGVGFPDGGQVRHYLANNNSLVGMSGTLMRTGQAITSYNAPNPPAGSGPHRYAQLVVEQPNGWVAPANFSAVMPLARGFQVEQYLNYSRLGSIIAATYYVVEGAPPTNVSVSATSAVPTATVGAVASSVSASLASAYASSTDRAGTFTPTPTGDHSDAAVARLSSPILASVAICLCVSLLAAFATL
ncbi:Phosphatidylethanolamine binding protein [Ceraceosorus bombacis]|uniref:Phosphatidylethanolamine binding protein n=1 Tax=Ceraceosorus bombacis TaxID=401625 RepID=A0A0P1BHB9_9BASI|nr:Phosphatidylethanolamine binding protein [Ceraceosorus bombacis]